MGDYLVKRASRSVIHNHHVRCSYRKSDEETNNNTYSTIEKANKNEQIHVIKTHGFFFTCSV